MSQPTRCTYIGAGEGLRPFEPCTGAAALRRVCSAPPKGEGRAATDGGSRGGAVAPVVAD